MTFSLQNDYLKATFNAHGGELTSLTDNDGINYIWCGDPLFWGRHAPVLFPVIGKIVGGTYTHEGKTYALNSHGFARDSVFEVTAQTETSITFTLTASDATREVYPFDFTLHIHYTLEASTLSVGYEVLNNSESIMPFKIGAHPAFNCPLFGNETMEDYMIRFSMPEETSQRSLEGSGLLAHDIIPAFVGKRLKLAPEVFAHDAIILDEPLSQSVTLESTRHDKKVRVDFDGFPLLGIWSPNKRSPFVCIEPWYGHADYTDESRELSEKRGMLKLEPNATFTCVHSYTVG